MPRLIDANKACRIVEQLFCGVCRSYTHCDGCPYNNVLMLLRNLPTIDAEPVRYGRWQVNETNGHKDMTCLSCGWLFEYYDGLEEEWNYCPHCGALQSFAIATERREDATND